MTRTKILIGLVLFLILASATLAGVPSLINYQGRLTASGGTPVADGSYSVTFKIYTDSVSGTVLWTETKTVTTSGGLFSMMLGSVTPVPDSAFRSATSYLGIKIGADPEISPRTRLASVPYSSRVGTVDNASGGTISGDLTVTGDLQIGSHTVVIRDNPDQILSSNGNLAIGKAVGGTGAWTFDPDINVGIGTTNPLAGLHVACNSNLKYALKIDNSASQASGAEITGGANSATPLLNVHSAYGGSNFDRQGLWVQSNGKVGIGTIAPTEKLHVDSGDVLVEGVGSFDAGGDEARVFLGDNSHYIKSIQGSGVRIGTFGVGDAVTILQSSGHVGVGTTNPTNPFSWQKILQVYAPDHAAISVKNNNKQYDIGVLSGGGLAFVDAPTVGTIMKFDSYGNVGIGSISPTEKLDVDGTARLRNMGGSTGTDVVVDANGKLWKKTSSIRYKENIGDLNSDPHQLLRLRPVKFDWKTTGEEDIGLIAEEVQKVVPALVICDQEGKPDAVKYDKITIYLLEVVKAQQEQIEALTARLAKLEVKR
ncbi:MAG: tail fiber domain-containing protein [candidate division Zixibacteria bacterium]|nr:tail fiber domain-containing protein [candidate division Zixibacteria bacterium]